MVSCMQDLSITRADVERWRHRAELCRCEAELTSDPAVRPERLETALAYERMADRAESGFEPAHEATKQPRAPVG